MADMPDKRFLTALHVEVCQSTASTMAPDKLGSRVSNYLIQQMLHTRPYDGDMRVADFQNATLKQNIEWINICPKWPLSGSPNQYISLDTNQIHIHVFKNQEDMVETIELDEGGDNEEDMAAETWMLPSMRLQGLWDILVFDSMIKPQLLDYAESAMRFSDCNVNCETVSCNRVVFLHGPPGTGKTTLCKALANKLAIRLSSRYNYGQLIEINSHSLFSKWFSESGKLVMKMFRRIEEMISVPEALVCVLIDEVESLTAARQTALAGSEPSDAIRVVNALLTQIDRIKRYPNVLILTTSNLTDAVDAAFLDRADIKQYIGPPSSDAIYAIYQSCILELQLKGIISSVDKIYTLVELENKDFHQHQGLSNMLRIIADKSEGLSGRTLRKLPLITHACFLHSPVHACSLEEFLSAMSKAVDKQQNVRKKLERKW